MAEFGLLAYDPVADVVWIPDGVSLSVAPPWETYRREMNDQSPAGTPQNRPPLGPFSASSVGSGPTLAD